VFKTVINRFVVATGAPFQHFQVNPYGRGERADYAILNIKSSFSDLQTY